MDVIKTADYVIDLGPEGGAGGGRVVAAGRPADVAKNNDSHTGAALAKAMGIKRRATPKKNATTKSVPLAPPPEKARTHLVVEAASEHNLKSVDVEVPRDAMTVFCGPSGSGKSSLAMDTIYAEGQRRYVESLSSYARQFIGQVQKPKVERIEGLSPAVALEQKNLGHSPRSTVGTVTEVFDYLRILMARLGVRHCPDCGIEVGTQTPDDITAKVLAMPEGTRAMLMAPIEVTAGEASKDTWQSLRSQGYQRIRIDGRTKSLDEAPALDPRKKQAVQVVVDRITVAPDERSRISDSVEQALSLGIGVLQVVLADSEREEPYWETITHSQHLVCGECGRSFPTLTPHHFSFNTSVGWCRECEGLGKQTGTNPAALIDSPTKTLAEGAALLWPDVDNELSVWMLRALSRQTDIPHDVPFEELTSSQRRLLFHGTGSRWLEVRSRDADPESKSDARLFRFQFKGFYPALDEASRLKPALRGRLEQFVDEIDCSACDGSRLRSEASACRFRGHTIADLVHMPLNRLHDVVRKWKLDRREKKIAGELMREIQSRVRFLLDVGLDYLTLHRGAATLSGGEAQRIRLASQLGSGLCGVLYVLDEPTIGLHPRDNLKLLSALHRLRDLGNTLLVVEHDRDVIAGSDHLCDFGPMAGRGGGRIIAQGPPKNVEPFERSATAGYLDGSRQIPIPPQRRPVYTEGGAPLVDFLTLHGANEHNLQRVTLKVPIGVLTVVTGPSGSGKSTLIEGTLYPILGKRLHRVRMKPGRYEKLEGIRHIDKVIRVDQSPLGNTPSSNPATYTGVFDHIRQIFAELPDAAERRFTARTFSFNVSGGRCETCEGSGQRRIEMHFLPDVFVPCEECDARRYNEDVLEVKYHGKSIADVLAMQIGDAVELFHSEPRVVRVLQTLCDVGLDYVTLGQPAPTLSGGEAQRVKLASELARPGSGRTLYLLDEPTTGLHFDDIAKLLDVVQRLVELGNTCVVIEHNLDVIKCADWVVDMGPGAGVDGGRIVFEGTPEALAATAKKGGRKNSKASVTAPFVAEVLETKSKTVKHKTPSKAESNGENVRVDESEPVAKKKVRRKTAKKSTATATASTTAKKRTAKEALVWKTLGRRWHSMPKGFEGDAEPDWPIALPDRLFDQIEKIAGDDCLKMAAMDRVDVVGSDGDIKFSIRTRDLDAVKIVSPNGLDAAEQQDLGEAKIGVESSEATTTLSINRLGQASKPALRRFLKRVLISSM